MALTVIWTQDLYGNVNASEVEHLLDEVPDATVFLDWPWLSGCFDHCPADKSVWILLLRDEAQRLRACLPFQLSCERQLGMTYKLLRWLQFPFADRLVPAIAGEDVAIKCAVIRALEHAPFSWDVMIWNEMPDQGNLLIDWKAAARQGRLAMHMQKKSTCPVMTLEGRDAAAMENSLSKSARQRVKRARKRLMQENNVQILHERPAPDQVMSRLTEFKAVENQSWKGEEGVGIFSDDASWQLFQTLSLRMAERGQLDLGEIRIEGRLASYRFGMCYRGVFLDYNLAYLPEYHKLGLGRILLDELVNDCAKQHYRAVDGSRVGRNSQHLLFERADSFIDHWQLNWYGTSAKGRCMQLINEVLIRNAKRARHYWRQWQNARAAHNASPASNGADADQAG